MEYYLPDEFVLIGYQHRTNSMQPEKNIFLGRGRTCVWPLFLRQEDRTARPNGPTERAQIKCCSIGVDITAVDGGGHILRTTRCCCTVACANGYRTDLAGEAQDSGWTQTRFFT